MLHVSMSEAKASEKASKASKASQALLVAAPTESPAPAIPATADACKTMAELDAWQKARRSKRFKKI